MNRNQYTLQWWIMGNDLRVSVLLHLCLRIIHQSCFSGCTFCKLKCFLQIPLMKCRFFFLLLIIIIILKMLIISIYHPAKVFQPWAPTSKSWKIYFSGMKSTSFIWSFSSASYGLYFLEQILWIYVLWSASEHADWGLVARTRHFEVVMETLLQKARTSFWYL